MKFIIEYGCDVSTEYLTVEANSLETALTYAEGEAFRHRESYEGFHGVLDYSEYCEENGLDEENEDSWEDYMDAVRWEIHYHAEIFDENNEDHLTILHDCNGEFFSV